MKNFRRQHPRRRAEPAVYTDYKAYRDDLKQDFNNRCGYTDCNDRWWGIKFQVDHFAPQNPKDITDPTKKRKFEDLACTYTNLVYACPQVNNAKRNLWVSDDPQKPIVDNKGLLDPCDFDYNQHFSRTNEGRIVARDGSPVAAYMVDKLKLYLFRYELYWRIDELHERKSKLHELRRDQTIMSRYSTEINELIAELDEEFHKYFDYIGLNHNEVV